MYPILLYIWNNSPPLLCNTDNEGRRLSRAAFKYSSLGNLSGKDVRGDGCSVHNIVNQSSDTRHLEMESV